MPNYLFGMGSSTKGMIGMSVNVEAGSRKKALFKLKKALENLQSISLSLCRGDIGRVDIHFMPENLTVYDIYDSDEEYNHA